MVLHESGVIRLILVMLGHEPGVFRGCVPYLSDLGGVTSQGFLHIAQQQAVAAQHLQDVVDVIPQAF